MMIETNETEPSFRPNSAVKEKTDSGRKNISSREELGVYGVITYYFGLGELEYLFQGPLGYRIFCTWIN